VSLPLQKEEQGQRHFVLQLIQDVDMTFFVKCGEGVDQDEFILFSWRSSG
jgi:hypothetical protein